MVRLFQVVLVCIPAFVAVVFALFGGEWSAGLMTARTWAYIAVSFAFILVFWNYASRVYLPESGTRPGRTVHPRWLIRWLWALSLGLPLLVMLFTAAQPWWEPGDLVRDPMNVVAARMERSGSAAGCCSSEAGAVSLLGNLITFGAASVFCFAAVLRLAATGKRDGGSVLLLLCAALAAIMALDDLFRMHEAHQRKFVIFYMTLLGFILFLSWVWLTWFENRLLLLAAMFFAVSILIDTVYKYNFGAFRVVIEDGAKLFGLCCLAGYAVAAGLQLTQSRKAPAA